MNKIVRQGDLLILSIEELPRGMVRQENNILALGEATGHKHEIKGRATTYVKIDDMSPFEDNPEAVPGTKYLFAEETVTLQHDEHGPIELEAGSYMVIRQREYDPLRNRMVSD